MSSARKPKKKYAIILLFVLIVSSFSVVAYSFFSMEQDKQITEYKLKIEAYVLSPVSNVVVSIISDDNETLIIEILDTIVSYNELAGTYNITAISTERYTVNQFNDIAIKFSGDFSRIVDLDASDFSNDNYRDSVWVSHIMTVGDSNIHVMLI